jgi:hypothetical protein
LERNIIAPFKPDIRNRYDVQYFDADYTSQEVVQTPMSLKGLEYVKKNQDKFRDI